jgi:hypothetical protein
MQQKDSVWMPGGMVELGIRGGRKQEMSETMFVVQVAVAFRESNEELKKGLKYSR